MSVATRTVGAAVDRVEGREKVTGAAAYAYEHGADDVAYAAIVQSTIAKGEIRNVDAEAALALPGVLAVLSFENAPRLHETDEAELEVLQSNRVSYRGQVVAAVVAETYETAREAERLVRIEYAEEAHDVILREDHPRLFTPEKVNPGFPTDTTDGDFDGAFAHADVTVDCTY